MYIIQYNGESVLTELKLSGNNYVTAEVIDPTTIPDDYGSIVVIDEQGRTIESHSRARIQYLGILNDGFHFYIADDKTYTTHNYNNLINKPQINSVTLQGNKAFGDLGLHDITIEEIIDIILRRR